MNSPNESRHINVDEIQQRLTVPQLAAFYRFSLSETFGQHGNQRMKCPVTRCAGHRDDRSVSINVSDPFKRWKCHQGGYGCGAQGNLIKLAYAMKHGDMPPGNKLGGQLFRETAKDLQRIADGELPEQFDREPSNATTKSNNAPVTTIDEAPNVPFSSSENEKVQALVHLDDQFTVDPGEMPPAASAYLRRRNWATPEFCKQHRIGYIQMNVRSSLRGNFAFLMADPAGQELAWIGRNVNYETQKRKFDLSSGGTEPHKYRFPKKELFRTRS